LVKCPLTGKEAEYRTLSVVRGLVVSSLW
jgi:hypothetical protein